MFYKFNIFSAPNFGKFAYFMFSPIDTDTPAMMPTKCCLISETDSLTSTSPSFESCLAYLNILYLRLKYKTDISCCVCVVYNGIKKDLKPSLFFQSNIFYSVHAWFRSICALAFIMWWEGRQIEQDSVCVIYTSISLLVLFWGCRCLCVGVFRALFVLSEILVPPRVPVRPALARPMWGPTGTTSHALIYHCAFT